jgi:hypothetical protein
VIARSLRTSGAGAAARLGVRQVDPEEHDAVVFRSVRDR